MNWFHFTYTLDNLITNSIHAWLTKDHRSSGMSNAVNASINVHMGRVFWQGMIDHPGILTEFWLTYFWHGRNMCFMVRISDNEIIGDDGDADSIFCFCQKHLNIENPQVLLNNVEPLQAFINNIESPFRYY